MIPVEEWRGKVVQPVETTEVDCIGCVFKSCICFGVDCTDISRPDGLNVIFVEVQDAANS